MKIARCIGPFVLMLCLGVPATGAWSSPETIAPTKKTGEQEAVVTKVESDTVTLRSLSDDKKIIVISHKDAGLLQAGDRVVLDGEKVRKIGSTSEPAPEADPAGEVSTPGAEMKLPAATPRTSPGSSGTEGVSKMK